MEYYFHLLFISLTLIFAVYWQYHKRKKQEELAQQRRIKRMQEEQYNQSLACIEENRRQMKKTGTIATECRNHKKFIKSRFTQSPEKAY